MSKMQEKVWRCLEGLKSPMGNGFHLQLEGSYEEFWPGIFRVGIGVERFSSLPAQLISKVLGFFLHLGKAVFYCRVGRGDS